jgi:1,4-alpha-glucan branching enzyme
LLSKIGGDDWQRFAGLRALLAWQASLPGSPLLFMGVEMAPWQEWNDAAELPWHLLEHAAHRGVRDVLQTINAASDAWPALWRRDSDPGGFQWLDANDADHSLYAFVRWDTDGDDAVVCIANFTPLARPGYRVGLPWAGEWQVVLDTDSGAFWGSGHRGADVSAAMNVGAEADNPAVVVGTLEIPYQSLVASAQALPTSRTCSRIRLLPSVRPPTCWWR